MANSLLAIDGLTIEEYFKQNLNNSSVFVDQNYEGSNLSILNKQFAYVFSLLLYSLNQNIHGGQFSETDIYENMSRILKMIAYKPLGYQTAFVPMKLYSTSSVGSGTYMIPRFSYVQNGSIRYTLMEDISFAKNSNAEELITDDILFYQGEIQEYKIPTVQGIPNERFLLAVNDSAKLDHNNIQVYVKRSGVWEKWSSIASLFLAKSTDKVYDLRFNENKKYEVTFGNGINGLQLLSGDQVVVFYLKSDATAGQISANVFSRRYINTFKSTNFKDILFDTSSNNTIPQHGIIVSNSAPSSNFQTYESVDEMRDNAPNFFNSQFRLINEYDFEVFIKSNFGSLIHSVKVMNNSEYLDTYMKYFYDMGLTEPELESRALFNQLHFADSCNFNNIYGFIVPKFNSGVNFVPASQKSLIINTIKAEKTLTSDFIVADPVYIYFDIAVNNITAEIPDDSLYSYLKIRKNRNSRRNSADIKKEVANILKTYFSPQNLSLGQKVDVLYLTNLILGIEGVDGIETINTLTGSTKEGIQLLSWNPSFEQVSSSVFGTTQKLLDFQFPYFRNLDTIENKITI